MARYVDALLVINNERLREVYSECSLETAFNRADDTLCNAARSIAEIITMHGIINLDFQDVCTVLKDGGVAIMSYGYGEGENRVSKAIQQALHSPLLNQNKIFDSKKILLSISFCSNNPGETLMMDEMNEVHEFMAQFQNKDYETKFGLCADPSLGPRVKVTILATGFSTSSIPGIAQKQSESTMKQKKQTEQEIQEKRERRDEVYGNSDGPNILRFARVIFKFEPEDLNNEEVISLVESTPTYKRNKEQFNEITSKASESRMPSIELETEPFENTETASQTLF